MDPGAKHATKGSNKKQTINSFKPSSFLTVAERNAACLSVTRAVRATAGRPARTSAVRWPAPIATSCTSSATRC